MSENATDDVEGLDASATHIANMLTNERDDSMFHCYLFIWGYIKSARKRSMGGTSCRVQITTSSVGYAICEIL